MTVDEIIKHLEGGPVSSNVEMAIMGNLLGWQRIRWRQMLNTASFPARGFEYAYVTTSLDAARLLFKLAFPGWMYRVAECCISDDAWVAPDFQHPEHGKRFQEIYPKECQRDPVEWFGADVDQRPPGRPAQAFCLSMMIAHKKLLEWHSTIANTTVR